ncbi:succinate dehydrogenase cytochrome b560 subunit [Leucosporidium creatinivorum]|uniref:Succinate dehydrogenase cytochrome b560 subunit n=1 Tax=Leucosporidium creatinivorum TaxID=106004 RepID=A0A1Y2ERY9_9BASI|nr:succinate dehydrogenase cytochrome b560 subunit [Leucosporidium creatinivorum]
MSLQNSSRQLLRGQALRRSILRPSAVLPSRDITTQSLTPEQNLELLNHQRSLRPNSPWHIYQPQLTSISSLANRATGAGLSAAFYALFVGHLVAPAVGIPFDSATLVQTFAEFPEWAKLGTKALIAGPASYHTLNGLRHLSWDTGRFMELKTSYAAGYAVMGATVVSTIGLLSL